MASSYWKTKSPAGRRQQTTWPSPVQVLSQVGIIVLTGVLWGILLVVYLRLTGGPAQAPAIAAPAPTTQATSVSFAKDVLPILEGRCVKCHGGGRTEAGLSLKSYADVIKGAADGPVVTPGQAANSLLVEVISSGAMPKNSPRLLPTEIQTISTWVAAGAPNN